VGVGVGVGVEMLKKNKNPTLRMWGTRTPHLGCGEVEREMVAGWRGAL
jgi:hypothetical protein